MGFELRGISAQLLASQPLPSPRAENLGVLGEREIIWQVEVKVRSTKEVHLSAERLECLFARGQGQSAAQAVG